MCIVFSAALHWRQALVQEIFIMKEYDALSEVKNWNKVNQLKFIAHSNMEICKFGLFKHSYKFGHDSLKNYKENSLFMVHDQNAAMKMKFENWMKRVDYADCKAQIIYMWWKLQYQFLN